jgi:esterase/lipase superfamily enzyme
MRVAGALICLFVWCAPFLAAAQDGAVADHSAFKAQLESIKAYRPGQAEAGQAAGTVETAALQQAVDRFRQRIGSGAKGALSAAEIELLNNSAAITAAQEGLDTSLEDQAVLRRLIAAGALDAEMGSIPARLLRQAVVLFRRGTASTALGKLTDTELEALKGYEASLVAFAGFTRVDHPPTGRSIMLPAALVSSTPDTDNNSTAWTTFSSPDKDKTIRVHLFSHLQKANTALSLATSLIPNTARQPDSATKFDFLQVTRDDFVIEGRTAAKYATFLNHSVGWERNGRVFGLKFTANTDPMPLLAVPALPDPDAGTGTDEDAKARNWLRVLRSVWNLMISDYRPLNGWERVDAKDCRGRKTKDGKAVAVIYATDRMAAEGAFGKEKRDADKLYSSARDDAMHLGCAIVWVPNDTHYLADLRSRIGRGPAGSASNDPAKHFDVQASELTAPLRTGADREIVLADRLKFRSERALLFVHGYNSSFSDALLRAAQIAAAVDYSGRVFVFSWPSQESQFSYVADMDYAEQAEVDLQTFMKMIVHNSPGLEVDIIAHSMGAQILLRSLGAFRGIFDRREGDELQNRIRLRQLIFAAPDVSELVFRSKLGQIRGFIERTTVYASANDGPLSLSSWFRGNVPRAGIIVDGTPVRLPDVDLIDITGRSVHWLNPRRYVGTYHSAFAYEPDVLQDIRAVLDPRRKLMSPMARAAAAKVPDKFEERRFPGAGTPYWVLKPRDPGKIPPSTVISIP